jgi:ribosomal protein S6
MADEAQIDPIEAEGEDTRIYEAAFHVIPSLEEAQAAAVAADIRAFIESKGGKILGGETPILTHLAYPMQKDIERKRYTYASAYFGWVVFESTGNVAHEVKKAVESNPSVLRSLAIKTVKAAAEPRKHPAQTVVAPPERSITPTYTPAPIPEKPAEPMTVEAMDAEIEKLVVE